MRYEMHLSQKPFEQILNGSKNIEVRIFDNKRKLLKIGDEILFILRGNEERTILKTIIDLRVYPSFIEMAENENCLRIGFENGYTTENVVNEYYKYYDKAEEKQFGVLVIELE